MFNGHLTLHIREELFMEILPLSNITFAESVSLFKIEEATVADMQEAMQSGELTSVKLVLMYLERIAAFDKQGVSLNSVLEINPDALAIAESLDVERKLKGPRGPLHGIPVLLKDNIDSRLHSRWKTCCGNIYSQGLQRTDVDQGGILV
jgi:hypothetical protein